MHGLNRLNMLIGKGTCRLLACLFFASAPLAAHAATNTLIFYDQVLTSGNGPVAAVNTPGRQHSDLGKQSECRRHDCF